jgi:hypothetical protein
VRGVRETAVRRRLRPRTGTSLYGPVLASKPWACDSAVGLAIQRVAPSSRRWAFQPIGRFGSRRAARHHHKLRLPRFADVEHYRGVRLGDVGKREILDLNLGDAIVDEPLLSLGTGDGDRLIVLDCAGRVADIGNGGFLCGASPVGSQARRIPSCRFARGRSRPIGRGPGGSSSVGSCAKIIQSVPATEPRFGAASNRSAEHRVLWAERS